MKRLVLAASVLALCGTSFAQSWSPLPKYASEHGKGYQYYFGRYSNGRFQFADGNFRNSALVVTKVSMRVQNSTAGNKLSGTGNGAASASVLPAWESADVASAASPHAKRKNEDRVDISPSLAADGREP